MNSGKQISYQMTILPSKQLYNHWRCFLYLLSSRRLIKEPLMTAQNYSSNLSTWPSSCVRHYHTRYGRYKLQLQTKSDVPWTYFCKLKQPHPHYHHCLRPPVTSLAVTLTSQFFTYTITVWCLRNRKKMCTVALMPRIWNIKIPTKPNCTHYAYLIQLLRIARTEYRSIPAPS